MTAINNLTAQDSLGASDLFPLWSGSNGDTRRVALSVLVAFIQSQISSGAGFITQYAAPAATGFSVSVSPVTNGASMFLLLTPLAGYAAGTIVLPAQSTLQDGQEILVFTTQAVTTLTISLNGAIAALGAPTTLAANATFRLRYDGVYKTWYRI